MLVVLHQKGLILYNLLRCQLEVVDEVLEGALEALQWTVWPSCPHDGLEH